MGQDRAVLGGEGGVIRDTPQRYGFVAIALHWTMAGLLLVLVVMGIYMVQLPDVGYDMYKITLILAHKALGVLALFAVVLRVAWRIANPAPQLDPSVPQGQQVAARFVHLCFYALMFALPLTGWLMSSAGGFPASFFGLFELPDYIPLNEFLFRRFIEIHKWLGWGMAVLIVVHAGAALEHHFVRRDETLRKILP
jgi:cytochrome b561